MYIALHLFARQTTTADQVTQSCRSLSVLCNELVRYRFQHNWLVVLRAYKVSTVWLHRL